jgi:hypothetical protein
MIGRAVISLIPAVPCHPVDFLPFTHEREPRRRAHWCESLVPED